MTDLRKAFRGADRLPAPELWDRVLQRELLPEQSPASRSLSSRVVAGIVALVVAVGGLSFAFLSFRQSAMDQRPGSVALDAGGHISFQSQGDVYIVDARANSTEARRLLDLTSGTGTSAVDVAWSPDGEELAFTEEDDNGQSQIFVANADGSSVHAVTSGLVDADHPAWSPDASSLAFSGSDGSVVRNIYLVRPDGTKLERITDEIPNGVDGAYGPAWSPDGRQVAYAAVRYYASSATEYTTIHVLDLKDGTSRALTDEAGVDESPAWSADGQIVAFLRKSDEGAILGVVRADGTGQSLLEASVAPGGGFAWSPSDETLAFADARTRGLSLVHADGSGYQNLVESQDITPAQVTAGLTWSPDGAAIAFAAGETMSQSRIFAINGDGSGLTQITGNEMMAFTPLWRPG